MPITDYPLPRKAKYTPTGSTMSFDVLVTSCRTNYGRQDYRIVLPDNPTLGQYVSASKLTFTEQEAP